MASKASEYVDVVGLHSLGPDATEADLGDYCQAAQDWLTEHEGDALSICVEPQRRGDVDGLFAERDGQRLPARHVEDQDEVERVRDLIGRAWDAWCSGDIGYGAYWKRVLGDRNASTVVREYALSGPRRSLDEWLGVAEGAAYGPDLPGDAADYHERALDELISAIGRSKAAAALGAAGRGASKRRGGSTPEAVSAHMRKIRERRAWLVVLADGQRHSVHGRKADAIDQADILHGTVRLATEDDRTWWRETGRR